MIEQIKIETKRKREKVGEEEVFIDPKGREYKAKLIPSNKKEGVWLVTTDKGKKLTLSEDQWDDYILEKGLTTKTNGHSVDTVTAGAEVSDMIEENTPTERQVEQKENADKILDNLDTTPPEDLNLQEVGEWQPGVSKEDLEPTTEPVVAEKPKRGRPKKVIETPPAIKQSLEEAGKIMAELEKPNKIEAGKLKQGQILWTPSNEPVITLEVVPNPDPTDTSLNPNLRNGYVLFGFPPKSGRNSGFKEEKVPFSKINKLNLIEQQTPFIELDEEEKSNPIIKPELESTAFADLKKELEQEGKWPETLETLMETKPETTVEPPPLPKEYLDNLEANKRLNELREEMREISHGDLKRGLDHVAQTFEPKLSEEFEGVAHGDLGADLAKDWTPIDVEMPKREPPLSPSLRKLPKKSWWQRLLGL